MTCKKCGHELSENAKYCEECGAKVENEDNLDEKETVQDEETVKLEEGQTDLQDSEEKTEEIPPVKEWYYVENNDSKGAFTFEQMTTFVQDGILNEESLVWKPSMKDWAKLKDTELNKFIDINEEENEDPSKVWYYVEDKDSKGPFTKQEIEDKMNEGILTGNSFVWKVGMEDWCRLKDTELVQQTSFIGNSEQVTYEASDFNIKSKSIGLYLVLSIVTCGLYGLYWLYSMAKDVNELAKSQGQKDGFEPFLVVILGIVTCHIYTLYFLYKSGKMISTLQKPNGIHCNDDSVVLLVLSLLGLDIVAYCILQSFLNEFSKD